MIDVLLSFAQKAGKKLKLMQKNVEQIRLKEASVASLVTKADIYVSNLFEKTIKQHFSHLNYMIIDEEKISKYGDNIFDKINNTEYQFVIDPIDGTVQYANHHPLYGISIGVYKNAKPLMGIIYLPSLNELIYFDGDKAYHTENCFKKNEIKTELLPKENSNSQIVFLHSWMWKLKPRYSLEKALFFNYFSAVSQSFYALTGKAKAYCMNLKLWDIAGTIPIANYLGMKIYEYGSSKIYDKISPEFFNSDMSVKNHCIMCYPSEYEEICSLVEPQK